MESFKIGDKAIYLSAYNALPVETTITKVTPKGAIHIAADNGATLFKEKFRGRWESNHVHRTEHVYPYSPEKWDALAVAYFNNEQRKEAKAAQKQAAQEAYDQKKRDQLETVKALLPDGNPMAAVRYQETMTDGTRLYWVNCPVNPTYAPRKPGGEVAIIKCVDRPDGCQWSNPENKVECHITYASAGSFASCSGQYYQNDAEAILDTLRDRYFSW